VSDEETDRRSDQAISVDSITTYIPKKASHFETYIMPLTVSEATSRRSCRHCQSVHLLDVNFQQRACFYEWRAQTELYFRRTLVPIRRRMYTRIFIGPRHCLKGQTHTYTASHIYEDLHWSSPLSQRADSKVLGSICANLLRAKILEQTDRSPETTVPAGAVSRDVALW
jgi:hypothetical protein